jgi:uncharacterized membrane protein
MEKIMKEIKWILLTIIIWSIFETYILWLYFSTVLHSLHSPMFSSSGFLEGITFAISVLAAVGSIAIVLAIRDYNESNDVDVS